MIVLCNRIKCSFIPSPRHRQYRFRSHSHRDATRDAARPADHDDQGVDNVDVQEHTHVQQRVVGRGSARNHARQTRRLPRQHQGDIPVGSADAVRVVFECRPRLQSRKGRPGGSIGRRNWGTAAGRSTRTGEEGRKIWTQTEWRQSQGFVASDASVGGWLCDEPRCVRQEFIPAGQLRRLARFSRRGFVGCEIHVVGREIPRWHRDQRRSAGHWFRPGKLLEYEWQYGDQRRETFRRR